MTYSYVSHNNTLLKGGDYYLSRKDWLIIGTGLLIGILAALLVKWGNPQNMGFCIACFLRDIAGGLGLHRAGVVQYLRPEIPGLVLGATIAALIGREFKSKGGSGTIIRFLLGIFMMIGALVFLGCPLRMLLRLGGGDLNALLGLVGFVVGIAVGIWFLKSGFNLGRAQTGSLAGALIMPLLSVVIVLLVIIKPVFNAEAGGPIFYSVEGPGSLFAPIAISLAAGLIVGYLAQRARLCLSGGIRDYALTKDTYLLKGYGGIFVGVLVTNLILGYFTLGFVDQPVAHTDGVWNFMGMALVGLACILAGGCPLRQLIMSGQGDTDGGVTVLGMVAGAAIAHNFMMASSAAGPTYYGKIAVIIGLIICAGIGWACREA
jgi:YedE family putative selenium metabolism protein